MNSEWGQPENGAMFANQFWQDFILSCLVRKLVYGNNISNSFQHHLAEAKPETLTHLRCTRDSYDNPELIVSPFAKTASSSQLNTN